MKEAIDRIHWKTVLSAEFTKCMHAIANIIKIATTSLDHQYLFQLPNYSCSQSVIGEQLASLAIG